MSPPCIRIASHPRLKHVHLQLCGLKRSHRKRSLDACHGKMHVEHSNQSQDPFDNCIQDTWMGRKTVPKPKAPVTRQLGRRRQLIKARRKQKGTQTRETSKKEDDRNIPVRRGFESSFCFFRRTRHNLLAFKFFRWVAWKGILKDEKENT